MKKTFFLLFILFFMIQNGMSQALYSKAYGNPKGKPLLFLHGGPGYNSAGFEITTAQALADKGFYVIVYDRRGEGRSGDLKAQFTFEETFQDINSILSQYEIPKVTLIGHSFGGIVATLYAEKNPDKLNSVILVSVPVELQETFKTILRSSRKIYEANNDKTNLGYIDMIEKMDPKSSSYYAYTFGHAMQNGFYTPKKISNEAKKIKAKAEKDPAYKYMSEMNPDAPLGFLKREKYTSLDLTKNLHNLISNKVKVYGIYGKDDGLYSPEQVSKLGSIIGSTNVEYFSDCSHNVFIDQQTLFIAYLKRVVK